jgi:hypothetical protein
MSLLSVLERSIMLCEVLEQKHWVDLFHNVIKSS